MNLRLLIHSNFQIFKRFARIGKIRTYWISICVLIEREYIISYKMYYVLLFQLIKVKPFNHLYQPIAYQCRQGEVKHWFMPIPSNNASNPLFFNRAKSRVLCFVCAPIYCKLFKLNQSLNETKATLTEFFCTRCCRPVCNVYNSIEPIALTIGLVQWLALPLLFFCNFS